VLGAPGTTALRLGISADARALWQLDGVLGTSMQTSAGVRVGWTFGFSSPER
jgi:hypothetical protein